MEGLPEFTLSPDQQHQLTLAVAAVDDALTLLPVQPTSALLARTIVVGLAAQTLLWHANLRLAMRIALDEHRRGHGELDELFQEGAIALQRAIRCFRPQLGYKLSTYAYNTVSRAVRNTEMHDHYLRDSRYFRWRRQQVLDEDPEAEDTHAAFARRVNPEVLDELADPRDHFEEIHHPTLGFLELIDERSAELLRMRFGIDGDPHTQEEAAEHFRVSTSTISRWETRALAQAKNVLEAEYTVGPEWMRRLAS